MSPVPSQRAGRASRQNRCVLVCAECGCVSDEEAFGWRAYRQDMPCEDDPPSVAIFCPSCAAQEFDPDLPRE